MQDKKSKLLMLFEESPWHIKLQILQVLAGWNQDRAAEEYGTNQKQVWAWNHGLNIPRRNSRKAIAEAHGVSVNDIFPSEILKPEEIRKGRLIGG